MKSLVKGGQGHLAESIRFDAIVIFVCIIVGLSCIIAIKVFEHRIDNVVIEMIEK